MKRKLKGLLALWMSAVLMLGILPGAVLAEMSSHTIKVYSGEVQMSGVVDDYDDTLEMYIELGAPLALGTNPWKIDSENVFNKPEGKALVKWKLWKYNDPYLEPGECSVVLLRDNVTSVLAEDYNGCTDLLLEPIWGYTVTFDIDGNEHEIIVEEGSTIPAVDRPNDPSKNGWTFDGWYVDSTDEKWEMDSDVVEENLTLEARWLENSSDNTSTNLPFLPFGRFGFASMHTISFNVNGGDPINSISRAFGTTVSLAKYVPTREGYNFTGWFTDSTLTKKVEKVVVSGATSLYAGWELIPVEEPAETTEETAAETTAE